jgi:hypothetical protein
MTRKEQAALYFVGALVVGAIAQSVAKQETAILGLTALEVGLIGLAVPVVVKRIWVS